MPERTSRNETHGCIVCGKLHQLLVVYEADGRLFDFKVMSEGGRKAAHPTRPLAACEKHAAAEVEAAVKRVYGEREEED
ncbi:MAG: hypothetical protein IPG44_08080 [Anaerolineales bacterium]|nr:hypothetical protein [Anaerolineales bacterium]